MTNRVEAILSTPGGAAPARPASLRRSSAGDEHQDRAVLQFVFGGNYAICIRGSARDETQPALGLFAAWVEEVDSCIQRHFQCAEELLKFLGQGFDAPRAGGQYCALSVEPRQSGRWFERSEPARTTTFRKESMTMSERPVSAWNEADAIRAAQQGDGAAFEFLYNCHSRRVYRVILRILRNVSDTEDLTQQVFLILFRKIGTFRGESCFSTWLHRIAVNTALLHLRRRQPAELQTDSLDADSVPPLKVSDRSMLSAADRISLVRGIQELPAGCRRLFILHVVLGYEHREVARLQGCSVGCSKSQVHKARRRLRALLRRSGQMPSRAPAAA